MLRCSLLLILIFIPIPHATADGCPIEFRVERQMASVTDNMLDMVPSVMEGCALSNRITNVRNLNVLKKAKSWVNIPSKDFFCGFGTNEAWGFVAQQSTTAAEHSNFNSYVNGILNETNSMIESRAIPLPWTSRRMPLTDAYKHIFGDNPK